jgi:D-alanine--poly(phosphoribitol) ligase subunit 2
MSDRDQVQQQIAEILREKSSVEVAAGDDLIDAGVLDSLTFVELILELEQRFGLTVDITSLELDDLRSVGRIVDFVDRNRPA